MSKLWVVAITFAIWLPVRPASAAVTTCAGAVDCVPRLSTVHEVNNSDLSGDSYTSFYLVSYGKSDGTLTPQDGAAGLFTRADCNGRSDDGGSVLRDENNLCFFRQNLNGDLRQWGITQGSGYDAIYNIASPSSIFNATPRIKAAIRGLGAVGISRLHTHQVSIEIGLDGSNLPLQLPQGGSFTCDAPPNKNADNGDYTVLPGSLIIAHASGATNFLDAQTNPDVEISNCAAIIPEWYINSGNANAEFGGIDFNEPGSGGFGYPDLEAIRANMIIAGDTAIKAGAGAYIHDVSILGFDNCFSTGNAPAFVARNVFMDCSIGAYFFSNGGGTTIENLINDNFLTKMTGVPPEEAWA